MWATALSVRRAVAFPVLCLSSRNPAPVRDTSETSKQRSGAVRGDARYGGQHRFGRLVVQFDEPSRAYQALSELNRMGSEGKVDVKSAVLLERSNDGTVQTPEGARQT
jgi:hypothetical protein